MVTLKEKYVIDKQGNRTNVMLEISEYHQLLEELEELDSLRAYDAAKNSGDEIIPFEQAISEIEKSRA
ncbi:MAG: hypothetical protein KGZ58_01855 [Ignavibacteriales bacterium]|nr:hypothetical protein [Ignavibacteriales bacterium]